MLRRTLAAVIVVAVAAGLAVAVWPQIFGLAATTVVAQVVAVRGLTVAVALALVVAFTLVALLSARARRFAAAIAVLLLAFCAVSGAVLATRGFGGPGFEKVNDSDITVLSWNTLGGAPGAPTIARLALDSGAQIVSLPETTREVGQAAAAQMAAGGAPMAVFTVAYDEVATAKSTTLLISTSLGDYTVDETATTTAVLPTVVARPSSGAGPEIMAVHSVAPVPGEMTNWRADLAWLAQACSGADVIMAGDFNSTLDNYPGLASTPAATLGGCADAALASGNAALGTWPTVLPALLGAPIDHVMATPNWRVTGMRVIQSHDGDGSDHRPILVQLSPAN
jgi:endonuclease/exonuclease/phosphatase (EEP) superfamily protein YafD